MGTENLVTPGNYMAKAVRAEYGVTTKNSKPYILIVCQILDPGGKYDGERLDWYGWFGDADQTERSMKSLALAGWDPKSDPMAIEVGKSGVGKTQFGITTQIEAGQLKDEATGEVYPDRARVAFINEPGATPMGKALDDAGKAAMRAKLQAYLAQKPVDVKQMALGAQTPASANGTTPPPASPPPAVSASGKALPV